MTDMVVWSCSLNGTTQTTTPGIGMESSRVLEKRQTGDREGITELMRKLGLSEEAAENSKRLKLGARNPQRGKTLKKKYSVHTWIHLQNIQVLHWPTARIVQ
jgi:hypothetical protein